MGGKILVLKVLPFCIKYRSIKHIWGKIPANYIFYSINYVICFTITPFKSIFPVIFLVRPWSRNKIYKQTLYTTLSTCTMYMYVNLPTYMYMYHDLFYVFFRYLVHVSANTSNFKWSLISDIENKVKQQKLQVHFWQKTGNPVRGNCIILPGIHLQTWVRLMHVWHTWFARGRKKSGCRLSYTWY